MTGSGFKQKILTSLRSKMGNDVVAVRKSICGDIALGKTTIPIEIQFSFGRWKVKTCCSVQTKKSNLVPILLNVIKNS